MAKKRNSLDARAHTHTHTRTQTRVSASMDSLCVKHTRTRVYARMHQLINYVITFGSLQFVVMIFGAVAHVLHRCSTAVAADAKML